MARHLAALAAGIVLAGAPVSAATLNQLASVQFVSNVPFDHQLQTARKLGFHRVRLAARWNGVEQPRGRYIWRSTDARIQTVLKAGMVPIIVLFGPNDGYPSPDGEKSAPPAHGEALAGFARFAAATVARYGTGRPDTPILYEIWNEPNTRTFWRRSPDPEGYARMAEAACTAIRAVAPQARILALGMEGWPAKAPYRSSPAGIDIYREWSARAASPALMACVDGISFHPYLSRPEQVLQGEATLQTYLAKVWRRPAPPLLANTEWGYTSTTKTGADLVRQAVFDLRSLLIGTGKGRVTNLYQSVDGGRDPAKSPENYGLVTLDGKIKPAGFAIQRLMQAIGDYQIDGVEQVATTPGLYRFTAHCGASRAQVLWAGAPDGSMLPVPLPADAAVTDLVTGGPGATEGNRLMVGAAPLLVLTK
jgi:hypothetical protein